MIKLIFFTLCLSLNLYSQKIEVQGGSLAGHYYDVPDGHNIDKYGDEWHTPRGGWYKIKIEDNRLGKIFLRHTFTQLHAHETGTGEKMSLGNQVEVNWDSPNIELGKLGPLDISLIGNLNHLVQNDHPIFFEISNSLLSDVENIQTLEWENPIVIKHSLTQITPSIRSNFQKEMNISSQMKANFSSSIDLAPASYSLYRSKLLESNYEVNKSKFSKNSQLLGYRGEFVFDGLVKYKDKYYLRAYFSQSITQSYSSEQGLQSANRKLNMDLGVDVSERLSLSLNVGNIETTLNNGNRRAVDVFNIFGLGAKLNLSK